MPEYRSEDTIAAIATPVGEGGISIIRLSGPRAFEIASKVFYPKKRQELSSFPSHTIHWGEIRHETGEIVDQALVSIFRSPNSYTAEDVIEISLHGGIGVSRHVLDLLTKAGARHAEPGEFTKRAFLNGKIDLTQAEAVLDLIKAKSERSLEAAARQLAGRLSQKLKELKDDLMKLYAHMEAYLDFPEEHLEVYSNDEMAKRLTCLRTEIERLIASFKRGSILREGMKVVIVGKPNVGKSSLFNALLERDRALVSEFPGTTRDLIEESVEINGTYVRMMDTAGLTPLAGHPLDQMSMKRTRQALEEADLYLYMVDGSMSLDGADLTVWNEVKNGKPFLTLVNKCDLPSKLDFQELEVLTGNKELLRISTKMSQGLELVEKRIADFVPGEDGKREGEQIMRLRHKNALEIAVMALRRAEDAFCEKQSLEFIILDLKAAFDSLRELVGEIYSEDLLDVIFSEFCIGK
jgi:tRNA modification GTPase